MTATDCAFVHERNDDYGDIFYEVISAGTLIIATYSRATVERLQTLLGDKLRWVPVTT